MTDFRIVAPRQAPLNPPTNHAHIVGVGYVPWQADPVTQQYTCNSTEAIRVKMALGDRFFTLSPSTSEIPQSQSSQVPVLPQLRHASFRPHGVGDDNLDNLPRIR